MPAHSRQATPFEPQDLYLLRFVFAPVYPPGRALGDRTFGLVSIHVIIGLLWSLVLIAATQPLDGVVRREKVIQWMGRATGMVFILFAACLAL